MGLIVTTSVLYYQDFIPTGFNNKHLYFTHY